MTTLVFPSNTIMAYVGPNAGVVGVNTNVALPVWAGDKIYLPVDGGANGGVRQFNIDPDGAETLQRNIGAIGISGLSAVNGGAACVSSDGTTLFLNMTLSNFTTIAEINASDLTLIKTFGIAAGTGPSDATHIILPWVMIPRAGDLLTASEATIQEIDSVGLPSFTVNTVLGTLSTAPQGFGVRIGFGAGGTAYLLGITSSTAAPIRLFQVSAGGVIASVGTISPAQIDATWTHITATNGIAFDQTDGNLLIQCQTTDAVTNKQYIIKINASTAAVMWKAVTNSVTNAPWSFTFARIAVGQFHYMDTVNLARHINTATGAQTTETVAGFFYLGDPQYSDDVTHSIILYSQFTAGGSPPVFVGSYMGPPGNNHGVTGWIRFWFAYTGNTYAAAIAESGSAVDVITAPFAGFKLWLHEFGMDETGESSPVAIRSYFETPLFGGPRSSPPSDEGIAFQQLEPDIKQSGDMVVWVAGSWNARAGDYASNAAFIKQNPPNPGEQLVGLQTSRRLGRLHIESYTLNGDYICGRSLLHVDKTDMHKLGGTTTPLLTADTLPAGAANPPFTEVGIPLSDFLPPTT